MDANAFPLADALANCATPQLRNEAACALWLIQEARLEVAWRHRYGRPGTRPLPSWAARFAPIVNAPQLHLFDGE